MSTASIFRNLSAYKWSLTRRVYCLRPFIYVVNVLIYEIRVVVEVVHCFPHFSL